MRFDMNKLERAAAEFRRTGEYAKAIRIYLFMADGDASLDGGYLGEQLGSCYEAIGDLQAARYWFGRAIEENPEVRLHSSRRRQELEAYDVEDLVPGFRRQS